MLRIIWRPAVLFLLPFVLYAILLVLRRATPLAWRNWGQGTLSTLTLVGLLAAVLGFFLFGVFAERHQGAYVPAHVENGVVIPGHME
ncbi:MAG TPA: DUF6111 family protein [Methylovirgula sp.]|nr:DUF6111 family protein [Methylovirgula sp.]